MSTSTQAMKALMELKGIKLNGLRFRVIDAKDQVVGRLAAQVAMMLQGKDKPLFNPKRNDGDVVIVVNAAHVRLTHDKWENKLYRWHSGYAGGLKERAAVDQWERNPTRILTDAIRGMLPKNKLRLPRLDKLKVFSEKEHPYKALELVPYVPPARQLPDRGLGWSLPAGFAPLSPERYAFRLRTAQSLRSVPRPPLDFSDLLGDDERRALAAASTSTSTSGRPATSSHSASTPSTSSRPSSRSASAPPASRPSHPAPAGATSASAKATSVPTEPSGTGVAGAAKGAPARGAYAAEARVRMGGVFSRVQWPRGDIEGDKKP